MGIVEAILGFLAKYTWRGIVGLCVASFAMLRYAQQLGTYDPAHPVKFWLVALFIFSLSILLTYPISGSWPWLCAQYRDIRMMHSGKMHLAQLTPDEKHICRYFVENRGTSMMHNPANGAVANLMHKNVLFTPGAGWANGMFEYRIQPWALKYLDEHPEACEK